MLDDGQGIICPKSSPPGEPYFRGSAPTRPTRRAMAVDDNLGTRCSFRVCHRFGGLETRRVWLLALMQFVITSANFHAIPGLAHSRRELRPGLRLGPSQVRVRGLSGRATDRRSRMLLQLPQGRGFGMGVRLRTMSLRPSRMIQGPGLKFGRVALGHGDWEKSVAKLVGQTGDNTRWPKQFGHR